VDGSAGGHGLLRKKELQPSEEKMFQGLSPESQGKNLAVAVLYVPHSLDSCAPYLSSTLPKLSFWVSTLEHTRQLPESVNF
jgi:hypothetical protein